jgi:hypothetical protein
LSKGVFVTAILSAVDEITISTISLRFIDFYLTF